MIKFFKTLLLSVVAIICIIIIFVSTIDLVFCIIDSKQYYFGSESMITNGGIKYISAPLYIIYNLVQILNALIISMFLRRKKYGYVVLSMCVYCLIDLIFSRHGLRILDIILSLSPF